MHGVTMKTNTNINSCSNDNIHKEEGLFIVIPLYTGRGNLMTISFYSKLLNWRVYFFFLVLVVIFLFRKTSFMFAVSLPLKLSLES